jgi:hypothetical protein
MKDILQIASFVVVAAGIIWRFSNILADIKTDLKLIAQKLNDLGPKLDDHEARIRVLESKLRTGEHA